MEEILRQLEERLNERYPFVVLTKHEDLHWEVPVNHVRFCVQCTIDNRQAYAMLVISYTMLEDVRVNMLSYLCDLFDARFDKLVQQETNGVS